MLRFVHDETGDDKIGVSLLDGIVRDGARTMLAAVLRAEGAAWIVQFMEEVDGPATGWWSATATTPGVW